MSRPIAVVVALGLLAAAPASAAPDARVVKEAERRFKRANALYHDGKYADALLLYQAAYDLVPSVSVLFNLGLTKEKLLDFEGCALAFQRYLSQLGPNADDGGAPGRHDSCRTRTVIAVRITSMPQGAAVAIRGTDGATRMLGRTPAVFELAPGAHEVGLELAGYEPRTERLEVEIGQRPSYDVVLVRLASLRVEADVSGATVRIEDGPAEPAPIEREVQAGEYTVVVSKPGHDTVTRVVRVASGKEVQVSVSLPPLPEVRTVSMTSSPETASIAIGGRAAVARGGRASLQLSPGAHEVVATAPGFATLRETVLVPSGRDLDLTLRLPANRSRASRATVWGLTGSAGVLGIAGGTFGVLALRDASTYDANPSGSLRDRGLDRRQRADLLLGAAVVTGGAALIYYLVTRPGPPRLEVAP